MIRRVLLCPPTYFEVRDVKNPYMKNGVAVDHAKARQQWETLRDALQSAGVEVETIDPVKDLEDMVFAANQVFVGYHPRLGNFIVPSEMRHVSRQREVQYYVDWFRRRGYYVMSLNLYGECLEGHGDLLWHPDRSRIWAGHGFRSTERAIEEFSTAMARLEIPVIPLQLVDEHFYHLDTSLCPLNDEAALVYPGAFSADSLARLRGGWQRIHELTQEEASRFMGNGIVAGGEYIAPHLTDHLEQILEQENLRPVIVETSEFEKSGGSLFCMKCVLA
jgi:N-dimethylarginine dimethylaminohydrolase